MTCGKENLGERQRVFDVVDYDLAGTLGSGQAFRWEFCDGGWESVLGSRWVRLTNPKGQICAQTAEVFEGWGWLTDYLQTNVDLAQVLAEFPTDAPMQHAVKSCRGLRLLRQEPWECLASFILSSTKQIVQIQQVVRALCACFGQPITVPEGRPPAHSFPGPHQLAQVTEADLRACKMGFRAPYLRAAAKAVASGELDLNRLSQLSADQARAALIQLPGVGPKIANCVLLFAYGFQEAFPVDVWISKALRELYFPGKRVKQKRLERFSQTHFGRYAGFAQQYLFHYMRTRELTANRLQSGARSA